MLVVLSAAVLALVLGRAGAEAGAPPETAVRVTVAGAGQAGFRIDAREVTVEEFEAYCRERGTAMPEQPAWSAHGHPVVNVTWAEANAYCAWAGGALPTEAQWERAVRGGEGRARYPWGETLDRSYANLEGVEGPDQWAESAPAGSLRANAWGVFDGVGNVWEWVADAVAGQGAEARVLRGGAWYSCPNTGDMRARLVVPGDKRHFGFGFRCAEPAP